MAESEERKFVREKVAEVAFATDSTKIGRNEMLASDILLNMYMLQSYQQKPKVTIQELTDTLGETDPKIVQTALKFGGYKTHCTLWETDHNEVIAFGFNQKILNAIHEIYYQDPAFYQLGQPMGLDPTGNYTGERFLKDMNRFTSYAPEHILTKIKSFFVKSLQMQVETTPNAPGFLIVTNSNANEYERRFLLTVLSSEQTPTTKDEIQDGYNEAGAVHPKYRLPLLVLAPSVNGDLFDWIERQPTIFCMWETAFIRFCASLAYLMQLSHEHEMVVRTHFNRIFSRNENDGYFGTEGSACYVEGHALLGLAEHCGEEIQTVLARQIDKSILSVRYLAESDEYEAFIDTQKRQLIHYNGGNVPSMTFLRNDARRQFYFVAPDDLAPFTNEGCAWVQEKELNTLLEQEEHDLLWTCILAGDEQGLINKS